GISPINQQNRELKAAMEARLVERGIDLPVIWGNRNWDPYMADAFREAGERGFRKLIAVGTSAYSSFSSCRQYREDYALALDATALDGQLQIDKVRQFFDHPGFVQPFTDSLREALASFESQGFTNVRVLFSTHSIPTADAERSGPEGHAYEKQHLAVAARIMADLGSTVEWQLVYQSRSGPPTQPWLEPDVNDVIAELPAAGVQAVAVVPLGFVSDHMEVLWDLDTEAKESAEEAGLAYIRTATPGTHPAYVDALIDLVLERRDGVPVEQRPAVTDLGPWYDTCRPGCCENVRAGFKPALCGVAP
ncbi:ferrochelatase, partial [Pseudolysinimonas sp.]|uniref:ferrochelatase n=1 Tax=Pseudolysinimonas sp. TaxID=2680009 RepID=UPI003784946E